MQVLDHAPAARRPIDVDTSAVTRNRWHSRRALATSAVLALLLGLMMVATIGPGVFTIDEMAYRTQAELAETGSGTGPAGWGVPYSSDDVVVQRLGAPFANAELGDSGWYPYARHPFYVEVVRSAQRALGSSGPAVLSLAAVVAGALALEMLARRLLEAKPLTTFWFVVVASPVAFHAFVVWAHALTFGLFAGALFVSLRHLDPTSDDSGVVGLDRMVDQVPLVSVAATASCTGALVFVATLLRSESPVAALALAGLVTWLVVPSDRRLGLTTALSIVGAALVGRAVDAQWAASIIDDRVPVDGAPSLIDNDFLGNLAGIVVLDGAGGFAALRIIGTGMLAVAALWFGRDRTIGVALAVGGSLLAFAGAWSLEKYSTMFAAAPVVWPALILAASAPRRSRVEVGMIGAGVATVLGAVIASPHGGGGAGWGGRYALIAFVFFVPVAVAQIGRTFESRHPVRLVLAGALLSTVAVQWVGVDVLERTHESSAIVTEQLEAELEPFSERVDLLITVDPRTGRLAPDASRSVPLVTVDDDEVEPLLVLAENAGVERVAIVGVVNEITVASPSGWVSVERGNVKSLQYWILELQQ